MKEWTPVFALCDTAGQVMAGSAELRRQLGETHFHKITGRSVVELARRLGHSCLPESFSEFMASNQAEQTVQCQCHRTGEQLHLCRLEGQPLVLIEFEANQSNEWQVTLSEVGRITLRLFHDLKNQIGGLKLYAAFLKRRFADHPEGVEISEKILKALNLMADYANLVTKLACPITLHLERAEPGPLIARAIEDLQPRAEARGIQLSLDLPSELPTLPFDVGQLRVAIGLILTHAIEVSRAGKQVCLRLQPREKEIELEITFSPEKLEEGEVANFFDCSTDERISRRELELALAKRIVKQHGGEVKALAAPPGGMVVRLCLPLAGER